MELVGGAADHLHRTAEIVAQVGEGESSSRDPPGDRPVAARVHRLGGAVRPYGRHGVVEVDQAHPAAAPGTLEPGPERGLQPGRSEFDLKAPVLELTGQEARALHLLVTELGVGMHELDRRLDLRPACGDRRQHALVERLLAPGSGLS